MQGVRPGGLCVESYTQEYIKCESESANGKNGWRIKTRALEHDRGAAPERQNHLTSGAPGSVPVTMESPLEIHERVICITEKTLWTN